MPEIKPLKLEVVQDDAKQFKTQVKALKKKLKKKQVKLIKDELDPDLQEGYFDL